jgi:ribose 5-phosphate isomerase A
LKPKETWVEEAKRRAASEAVKHVKNKDVVGLGSGSTAAYAIEALGERVRHEKLRILGVATSYQAFALAVKHRITITTLEEHPTIDLTIDGADQIDAKLDLIKGMGGALTREKIVASASKRNIIVADISKKVNVLGENNHPVPIEVLPFAACPVTCRIEEIGGKPVLREGKGKVLPVITEDGNVIIDATFGLIDKPADLDEKLKMIPGVVETGLFVGSTDVVYLGTSSTVKKMERKRR